MLKYIYIQIYIRFSHHQGFAAAHELVVDTLRTDSNSLSADSIKAVLSAENTSEDSGLSTAIIVDHDAEAYRLGLAKNSSHGSSTSGGGGGGSMLSSPRIWARLGAADSSTHGEEVAKTDRANSRNSNKVQDPVTNAFFPPPHAAGSRRNSGPIAADEITPQDAESSGGGSGCEGATTGGVSDPVGGGAASAGGGGGPGSSPVTEGLFKGAAMLRGINIDVTKINVNSMGVNMNNLWKGGKTPLPAADAGGDTPRAAAGVTVDAAADKEAATAAATPSSTEEDSSGGSGIASASASASVATSDLASKLRMSFGRFSARSSSSDSKAEAVEPAGGGGVGGEAGNSSSKRDSGGFGSLLRKVKKEGNVLRAWCLRSLVGTGVLWAVVILCAAFYFLAIYDGGVSWCCRLCSCRVCACVFFGGGEGALLGEEA